jgi:nucleotide-binding universal stress UspA family protein
VGGIVVGVDGSPASQQALHWAIGEAEMRRAPVQVVYVYEHSPAWQVYGYGAEVPAAITREELEESAAAAQERARLLVTRMLDGVDHTAVHTEVVVHEDRRPARGLVDLSADADLLVIGTRGRGGFAGLLLGSVSQQVVQHAECPVVVIPAA